jgi:hypothetical protein
MTRQEKVDLLIKVTTLTGLTRGDHIDRFDYSIMHKVQD